ncbi:proline-rich receptor-like protein kinase PERK2 [Iris pallida]|uniref:Proline-rich receptor-like protein kinase PERK2 n=1 Tax=Iris pallida TaxID=29817 RepID=A0AAX6IJ38_IRIPA|nr:proline-rich receptor-like protein kinase PERK2 [Iris pallida]
MRKGRSRDRKRGSPRERRGGARRSGGTAARERETGDRQKAQRAGLARSRCTGRVVSNSKEGLLVVAPRWCDGRPQGGEVEDRARVLPKSRDAGAGAGYEAAKPGVTGGGRLPAVLTTTLLVEKRGRREGAGLAERWRGGVRVQIWNSGVVRSSRPTFGSKVGGAVRVVLGGDGDGDALVRRGAARRPGRRKRPSASAG